MKTHPHEVGDTVGLASILSQRLQDFLSPLLLRLDQAVDRRLVRTFAATIAIILHQRQRASALLLSGLGAFLCGAEHAPAGTKRLSNLLCSSKWSYHLLEDFLWQRAEEHLSDLVCRAREPLLLWDESVLEKPESIALEGLGSVRSTKAARLKRIKKGYYTPPGGPPVFVPGMHWLSLLLVGLREPARLAAMRWWTTRGERAEDRRAVEGALLRQCAERWGRCVLHVFDRGFAGAPWLEALAAAEVRFVLRWPARYHLQDLLGLGDRPAWRFATGKKTRQHRELWDSHSRSYRRYGVLAIPVRHWAYPEPLWLIVSRRGRGHQPWYLLTNEPAERPAEMWRIVFAYARRWQVEMTFRFAKSELAMESPRLWFWENRLKLLLMVSLAYAFLLTLLDPELRWLRDRLLQRFCPRTGQRSRERPRLRCIACARRCSSSS